jgi:hypothetical protein
MENKFVKFTEWEGQRFKKIEEDKVENPKSVENRKNAELLARLADVQRSRKDAIRDKNDFEAKILEIEGKLLKIELDKNDLLKKRLDLEEARNLSLTTRKEGKTNVKENQ